MSSDHETAQTNQDEIAKNEVVEQDFKTTSSGIHVDQLRLDFVLVDQQQGKNLHGAGVDKLVCVDKRLLDSLIAAVIRLLDAGEAQQGGQVEVLKVVQVLNDSKLDRRKRPDVVLVWVAVVPVTISIIMQMIGKIRPSVAIIELGVLLIAFFART